jgi:hypothetical protein
LYRNPYAQAVLEAWGFRPNFAMKWLPIRRFTYLLPLGLCVLAGLGSCQDRGFLTPPPQLFGGSLNSLSADQAPRFSYDGRYIVFVSDRQSQRRILLYDVRQRSLINLPGLNQPKVFYDQPDISADGRYIVYISEERGKPDVFVYDRQNFESEAITENLDLEVRNPTISGNGRFVSFAANRSGQWDIEIYDRGTDTELSLPVK